MTAKNGPKTGLFGRKTGGRRKKNDIFAIMLLHFSWFSGAQVIEALELAALAGLAKKSCRKTYRRFSGTIFGRGAGTLQVVSQQGLASRKIPKNEKHTKKNVIFFARTPRFSAKQARFGAVFGCQTITHSASGFP